MAGLLDPARRPMLRFAATVLCAFGALVACSGSPESMETQPDTTLGRNTPTRSEPAESPDSAPGTDPDLPVILAFGDSLTNGLGVDARMNYPSQLERKLNEQGYAYRVVNGGIDGDTTSGGLARLDRALELRPELVILELGANDGLRGTPLETARGNLAIMIEAFQSIGTRVVLAGLTLPRNYGPDYIRDFENMFADLSMEYGTVLMPFFLEGLVDLEALDRGEALPRDFSRYMQSDGTHPTAEGYTMVADTVFAVIEPLLQQVPEDDSPAEADD